MNLLRAPTYGRNLEILSEDPFHLGALAVEYANGLQLGDAHYLKVGACSKHYAVHDGPESDPVSREVSVVCRGVPLCSRRPVRVLSPLLSSP